MIYLDNSATTKPCEEAVAAITAALTEGWANPSALYSFGIDAAHALRNARHQVAAAMGAEHDRIFFTSGGTEADNWAIFGAACRFGKKNKHIITTAIEHHAILHCMKELESQGFEVTYLQPDGQGRITLDALKAALRKDTFLVSVMMVNNEVGSVMPISQMAKLTHRICPDAIFHTDAVQGFMKIPFAAKTLGADLISVSSHKVHGPKGAGALYISPRLRSFPALLFGGGVQSMVKVFCIVCLSSCYSGIFRGTGLLEGFRGGLNRLSNGILPFGSILVTSILTVMVSCNQALAIMLTHQLCMDVEPDQETMASHLENTVVVIAPLIPWSIAGAVPLATVGAPTACILTACYLYLLPVWNYITAIRNHHKK